MISSTFFDLNLIFTLELIAALIELYTLSHLQKKEKQRKESEQRNRILETLGRKISREVEESAGEEEKRIT